MMRSIDLDRNRLEEWDAPMPKTHWMRHKKASVDLLNDSPFALDRQLEDQRYLMKQNKNPRANELTTAEKPRSEKITASKGTSNPLNMKAKVLNKIVREASGIHNYAIVAPITNKRREKLAADPETHPLTKPYREQMQRAPIMCSFGHRPSSASRTYHPATMKFRLKHGEIAPSKAGGRSGVGLAPAMLAKLLHAPKLEHPSESMGATSMSEGSFGNTFDPNDLFLPHDDLFASSHTPAKADKPRKQHKNNKHVKLRSLSAEVSSPVNRPSWNNHFHSIEVPSKEIFELKASGLSENQLMPLDERLKRFAEKSAQESKPQIFCSEKQESDKLLRQGKALKPSPANIKENPYYDPIVEAELKRLKHEHQIAIQRRENKIKKKLLRDALKTIPKVDYHPDTMIIENAKAAEARHFPFKGLAETPATASIKEEAADDIVEMINAGQFKDDDDLFDYFMKSKVTVTNKNTKKVEAPLSSREDLGEIEEGNEEEREDEQYYEDRDMEERYDDAGIGTYHEEDDD